MAQHVHMHRKRQPSRLTSPFYHTTNAHAAERLVALVDEHVAGLNAFGGVGPPQVTEGLMFVTLEIVAAVGAALQPADDDRALAEIDIVPAERK
jgi:hypothetical protein